MKKQPIPGSLRLWQLVVFLIAPVLCALVCLCIGRMNVPVRDLVSLLLGREVGAQARAVLWSMRLPGRKMAMECNEFEIRILSGTDGLCTHKQYLLAYSRRNGGGCRRGKAVFIWVSCGGYIIIDTES